MTRSFPEWAYLVDERGRSWYNLPDRKSQPINGGEDSRPPVKAIYAIPTRDLVSLPQWVSSKDSDIISEVVNVETEKFGFKNLAGPGKTTDWVALEHNGTRTLVQSLSIPWPFESVTNGPTEFTDFVPQYALFRPHENSVMLWKEGETWVAGYSRGAKWVHVQSLGESVDGHFLAGEIQLTLVELSAKGVLDHAKQIVVWQPYDMELHQALETGTGMQVQFQERPAPEPAASADWDFEPHEVSLAKQAQTSRRRAAWITFCGLIVVLGLVGAAVVHLYTMQKQNQSLEEKIQSSRPAAELIESAMAQWDALGPAVEQRRNPVELFHQVSSVLPEKGFRITSFELQDSKRILIRGEGANMPTSLSIKAALEKEPGLSDWTWEIPQPRPKDDLFEFTATGIYRF